jgi:hypothetical protein
MDTSVYVREVLPQPDPTIVEVLLIVDRTAPLNKVVRDLKNALRARLDLPYRKIADCLAKGILLHKQGLTYRQASIEACGTATKADSIRYQYNKIGSAL